MNPLARIIQSRRLQVALAASAIVIALFALAGRRRGGAPAITRSGIAAQHTDSGAVLTLSDEARAMAAVQTASVERRKLDVQIRAYGKVQPNETGLATITSRVEGYVERLFVDYVGIDVEKGDHLIEIYSPDLAVAQRELLSALKNPENALVESAKLKLRRWDIGEDQINELVQTRQPQERMLIQSPIRGTVYEKAIVEKSAVHPGDVLYRIANLDSVWVYLDIYEYELSWIKPGQGAEISAEAFPGEKFEGMVTFIQPFLSEETRTIRVRVNISNPGHRLKPGMFASATIDVPVIAGGKAGPTGREGKFSCPMHPEVLQETAGNCPICGMELKKLPGEAVSLTDEDKLVLSVPVSAVLDSGLRKLAYIERTRGEFVPAEIKTGPRAGDFYPVLAGLNEGDQVAVRGNFLLDSQFQISGLPSLFFEKGQAPSAAHHH
ncbi:efflux RND transporter periplasmic adaptor subunit, partial [Candidatus Sumerlaeota bacterium]|nr:efflux RND transporter periplasmic adaptor subunit [Candidatus Sumerlaeota bacterium]